MTLFELFLAILTAIAIGLLFYFVFRVSGPWGTLWSFLLILILAALAAELWVTPIGPVYYDFAWLPTLFVILIFALLIAAATPPRPTGTRENTREIRENYASTVVGGFFWFLIIFLIVAVILGFLM